MIWERIMQTYMSITILITRLVVALLTAPLAKGLVWSSIVYAVCASTHYQGAYEVGWGEVVSVKSSAWVC